MYEPIEEAQQRLLDWLRENDEFVRRAYSQDAAQTDYGDDYATYQIYAGKLLDSLRAYMERPRESPQKALAWRPRHLPDGQHTDEQWVAVHPKLGEAIMSVMAIAIAQARGMDIVTDSGEMHHALAVRSEEEVLGRLGSLKRLTTVDASVGEMVDELAGVVMRTSFDLEKLTADDIAGLIGDGLDLRRFKDALVPFAQSIDGVRDPAERHKRLVIEADRFRGEWEAYKKALPRRILDTIVETAGIEAPAYATGMIASAPTALGAYAAAGLGLFVVLFKGNQAWRKFKAGETGPYSYLSRIEGVGATLIAGPAA